MLRPSLTTAAVALLCASAMAQGDLSSRLKPITAPYRNAGVYHVATGTWTRNASQAILGPDIIYNNACNLGYYTDTQNGELFQHRSRLPTTAANAAPTVDSEYYGSTNAAHRYDKAPGCDTKYVIQHFLVVYCSAINGTGGMTIDWFFSFADAYTVCTAADMIPDPACDYLVTGLPVGSSAGAQNCWIVDIDLEGITPVCSLNADQDGTFNNPRAVETFGYSQGPASAIVTPGSATGPVLAGNFTWTGGTLVGVMTPCTGADGTIWDTPIDLTEDGTGMNSQDFFRVTGVTPSSPAGCYYFNSPVTGIHADFYLKLFSKSCGAPVTMTPNCIPGQGGVINCPCPNVNPGGSGPAGGGLGCNNYGVPANNLSATLSATGDPSIGAGDTVDLHLTGANNGGACVFWTGKLPKNPTGVAHAAGVRCVTAALKRLYTGNVVGGNENAGPSFGDPQVSVKTQALYGGTPIAPGEHRKYFVIYRDPNASAANACAVAASTVNLTNSGDILWHFP